MKKIFTLLMLLCSFSLFAQNNGDAVPRSEPGQALWQPIAMFLIAAVFFYFILWRPEQRRRKMIEAQRSHLKKGDRVTAMGIIGTVLRVQDQTVILKMYDGSKVEFLKGAVTDVTSGSQEDMRQAEKESAE